MASTPGAAGAGAADPGAVKAWEAVRAAADIQYAPMPPPPIPKEPEWLKALGEWLKAIFEPLGRALGLSWPVIEYILLGLAALAVALIVWRIAAAVMAARRKARPAEAVPEWAPSAYEAQAARLLAPAGPCLLLDLRRITHGAPPAASLLFHA